MFVLHAERCNLRSWSFCTQRTGRTEFVSQGPLPRNIYSRECDSGREIWYVLRSKPSVFLLIGSVLDEKGPEKARKDRGMFEWQLELFQSTFQITVSWSCCWHFKHSGKPLRQWIMLLYRQSLRGNAKKTWCEVIKYKTFTFFDVKFPFFSNLKWSEVKKWVSFLWSETQKTNEATDLLKSFVTWQSPKWNSCHTTPRDFYFVKSL